MAKRPTSRTSTTPFRRRTPTSTAVPTLSFRRRKEAGARPPPLISACDCGADARGYSWGVAGEYFVDQWVFRAGRFLLRVLPSQLQLDHQLFKHYADQVEIERGHTWAGRPGKFQVLAYRNVAQMGRWDDAMNALASDPSRNAANCTEYNYSSANSSAPDLCYVRGRHVKYVLGVSLEQAGI